MKFVAALFLILFPQLAYAEPTVGHSILDDPSKIMLIGFSIFVIGVYLFVKLRSKNR